MTVHQYIKTCNRQINDIPDEEKTEYEKQVLRFTTHVLKNIKGGIIQGDPEPEEEPLTLHRILDKQEEEHFRQWARKNYLPGTDIPRVWHPVVREECKKMNDEQQ